MLIRPREDGMIQCARYETQRQRKPPHKIWTEYESDFDAKTEYFIITPPVDLSVQEKAGQEELNGELGNNIFHNLNHDNLKLDKM